MGKGRARRRWPSLPLGKRVGLQEGQQRQLLGGTNHRLSERSGLGCLLDQGRGAKISKEKGIKGEVLTMPVASFPESASPYGLYDMAGNVSEWVQDWYNPNYYNDAPLSDPQGPPRGAIKAMRGGSWLKPAISLRTSDRDWGTMDSRPSGAGFRCAKDAF